jgi:hypothetical protein
VPIKVRATSADGIVGTRTVAVSIIMASDLIAIAAFYNPIQAKLKRLWRSKTRFAGLTCGFTRLGGTR